MPVGVTVEQILELLIHITIWTDKDQIWDAWRADALVLRRDHLVVDNLQQLWYRECHIIAWLIGQLNICGSDAKLRAELDHVSLQGQSCTPDAAAQRACLQRIRSKHGGTPPFELPSADF